MFFSKIALGLQKCRHDTVYTLTKDLVNRSSWEKLVEKDGTWFEKAEDACLELRKIPKKENEKC